MAPCAKFSTSKCHNVTLKTIKLLSKQIDATLRIAWLHSSESATRSQGHALYAKLVQNRLITVRQRTFGLNDCVRVQVKRIFVKKRSNAIILSKISIFFRFSLSTKFKIIAAPYLWKDFGAILYRVLKYLFIFLYISLVIEVDEIF